jgi:hypothetical protein
MRDPRSLYEASPAKDMHARTHARKDSGSASTATATTSATGVCAGPTQRRLSFAQAQSSDCSGSGSGSVTDRRDVQSPPRRSRERSSSFSGGSPLPPSGGGGSGSGSRKLARTTASPLRLSTTALHHKGSPLRLSLGDEGRAPSASAFSAAALGLSAIGQGVRVASPMGDLPVSQSVFNPKPNNVFLSAGSGSGGRRGGVGIFGGPPSVTDASVRDRTPHPSSIVHDTFQSPLRSARPRSPTSQPVRTYGNLNIGAKVKAFFPNRP